jgi:hypothetical protein
MPNHIAWASPGKRGMGENGTLSPMPMARIETSQYALPKCFINKGFWRFTRFSLTEGLRGKIQIAATTTDTKNIRLTK